MDKSAFHKFEHDFWDKTSASYDAGFGDTTAQTIPHMLDIIGAKQGDTILDVACGPGYVTSACRHKGIKVFGLDFSTAMIDLAKVKNPDCDFHVGDAEALPFEDSSFDGVTCNFGILHFPDPQKAMREAYRVCKAGGRYAFTLWNKPEHSPAMSAMMNAVQNYTTPVNDLPQGLPFFHFAEEKNSRDALKNAGFMDINFRAETGIWTMKSAQDFIGYFRDGGARIGAILRAQSHENLERIIAAVATSIAPYEAQNGYDVPVSYVIVGGLK